MVRQENVMVVDDDERLLETLSLILKWRGYNVDTARDGASALEKCRLNHYDVTLIDIGILQMSGLEAARCLREIDSGARVILMKASYEGKEVRSVLEEGAYQAIDKPVDITNLIKILKGTATTPSALVVEGRY